MFALGDMEYFIDGHLTEVTRDNLNVNDVTAAVVRVIAVRATSAFAIAMTNDVSTDSSWKCMAQTQSNNIDGNSLFSQSYSPFF